jgi:hypothetical protein
MATPENIISHTGPTNTLKVSEENNGAIETPKQEVNSTEVSWSDVSTGARAGDMADETEDDLANTSSSCSTSPSKTTVHVTFTPLNSPLNTPYSMASSHFGLSSNMNEALRTSGSQSGALLLTQTPIRSSQSSYFGKIKSTAASCSTGSIGLSKRQANLQVSYFHRIIYNSINT